MMKTGYRPPSEPDEPIKVRVKIGGVLSGDETEGLTRYVESEFHAKHGANISTERSRPFPWGLPEPEPTREELTTDIIFFCTGFMPFATAIIQGAILEIVKNWIKQKMPDKSPSVVVNIYGPSGDVISTVNRHTIRHGKFKA